MTDPATRCHEAGHQLDTHVRDCPACVAGIRCADGDDIAEREYRAWRDWQRADADGARRDQMRGRAW